MTAAIRRWGQGAPALLLHCSLAHAGAWQGLAGQLADRLSMVAPDFLGHGKAPDPDPSQDYHTACLAQVRSLVEVPAHVIGHSFGATIALRMAVETPELVRSLTLIEPVFFAAAQDTPGYAQNLEHLAGLGPAFATGDMVAAARIFLTQWGDGEAFDDLPEKQKVYILKRMPLISASHKTLYDDTAGLLPKLGSITQPTLLLEGSASPAVIAEVQRALCSALPDCVRKKIDGAGHMLPITHPGPVAQEISAFLDQF